MDENAAGVARPIAGAIAFEGVAFGYGAAGETPTLREITFSAQPGETIAIVGQTGAGKTTLTRLINRTFDPSAGRVSIDGVDLRDWSLASLRSQIATIEQDTFLFSRSIAENFAFGARGRATAVGSTSCRAGWRPMRASAAHASRSGSGNWWR